MSKPIVAHGAGLAGKELLVLLPFLPTGERDGGEDAEILEQQ